MVAGENSASREDTQRNECAPKSQLLSLRDVIWQTGPHRRPDVRNTVWTLSKGAYLLLPYLRSQMSYDAHGRYDLQRQAGQPSDQLQARIDLLQPLFHVLDSLSISPLSNIAEASTKLEKQRFASLRLLTEKPKRENWFVADGILVTSRRDVTNFDPKETGRTSLLQLQPFQYLREEETREERKWYDNVRLQLASHLTMGTVMYETSVWQKQPESNGWRKLDELTRITDQSVGYEMMGNSLAFLYGYMLEAFPL